MELRNEGDLQSLYNLLTTARNTFKEVEDEYLIDGTRSKQIEEALTVAQRIVGDSL